MDNCPLTGKPCDKKKICHITDIEKDGCKELHLCEPCAAEYLKPAEETEVESPPQPAAAEEEILSEEQVGEIAQSVFEFINNVINLATKKVSVDKGECPDCGISLSEIIKHGRLGCAGCYDWFKDEMVQILDRTQGSLQHLGKHPSYPNKSDTQTLQQQLTEAIDREDYEKAAYLRDQIAKQSE